MKTKLLTLILVLAWALAGCAPLTMGTPPLAVTKTPTSATPTPAEVIFKTAVGDLVYDSARFVSEVNGVTPAKGCKLLLVGLRRPDGTAIDVGQFEEARMQIFIHGEDGSETLSTMGGLVDGKFAIGFQAPDSIKTYRLVWGDNPPLEIFPLE